MAIARFAHLCKLLTGRRDQKISLQLHFINGWQVGVARVEFPLLCVLIGVAIHLCLLSALTWMVICSTHMYRVFSRAVARSVHQVEEDQALYLKHVTLSVLIPALIVILTLTANGLTNQAGCGLDLGYGKGICYLSNTWSLVLASVLPVCGAVLVNLALFAVTVYALRSLSHDLKEATQQHRQQLAVYIRLSTLTGVCMCMYVCVCVCMCV